MAKRVFVNWRTGSNTNDGLSSGSPKKTILGARSATAASTASTSASPDIVLIAPGVYYEDVNGFFNASTDNNVIYASDGTGEVIVDFENKPAYQDGAVGGPWYWRFTVPVHFVGINFRDFVGDMISGASTNRGCLVLHWTAAATSPFGRLINCAFYQRNATADGRVAQSFNTENCSFFNLDQGLSNVAVTGTIFSYGNYFKTVGTPYSNLSLVTLHDYNAFSGNTETNGLNTASANNDPGFRDASNDDMRLDPTTDSVAWGKFLSLGRFGGRIAATGKGGIFHLYDLAALRMITTVPASVWPAWENDPSYSSPGTLGTIIQDSSTGELKIDLVTTPTATDGRVRSDVYDLGSGSSPNLASISIGRQESISSGEALDTNTTLPQKWEYRSSNTSFAKGDGSPSWTEVEDDTYINVSNRYVQFRVTFVTNHTNA